MNFIQSGSLKVDAFAGQAAIVTGAGRGIGFQAARALLGLGANVIIAEIDRRSGKESIKALKEEFRDDRAAFIHADVGSERSVRRLKRKALKLFGQVDIVVNNATITPMGPVLDVPVHSWDSSYRVNLRGPVLLAQAFLPAMIERDYGVFVCVSSVGEAYMGAYETFKAAQTHLGGTLDAEIGESGVHVFTIDPGLVRTPGLQSAAERLAPLYGKTVEEFYAISAAHELSAEAAGGGFAAAVALAPRFRGQEISAKQALLAAGINISQIEQDEAALELDPEQAREALELCYRVQQTLKEQSHGWSKRSLFERQWMLRDFKKNAGMPVERWLETLAQLEATLREEDWPALGRLDAPIHRLADYYVHMQDLARGYEKDSEELKEQLSAIRSWENEAESLANALDFSVRHTDESLERENQ
jgi:NAD(P)-dependent dehydrogenase (short-subunit alcohol dehydrogenase family)